MPSPTTLVVFWATSWNMLVSKKMLSLVFKFWKHFHAYYTAEQFGPLPAFLYKDKNYLHRLNLWLTEKIKVSSCNLLLICLSNLKVWQIKITFQSLIDFSTGKMILLHFTAARVIPSAARVIPSAAALIPSSMIWDWLIVAAPTAIRTRAGWLNTVWDKNKSDNTNLEIIFRFENMPWFKACLMKVLEMQIRKYRTFYIES